MKRIRANHIHPMPAKRLLTLAEIKRGASYPAEMLPKNVTEWKALLPPPKRPSALFSAPIVLHQPEGKVFIQELPQWVVD